MLPQTPGARPKILVADDDDLLSEVLVRSLESQGYLVSRAPGGLFSLASALDVDLVVLDAHIPGVDFATTLRLLKSNDVAVLVLTGEIAPPIGVDSDQFLAKPVDLDHLLTAVRRLARPESAA